MPKLTTFVPAVHLAASFHRQIRTLLFCSSANAKICTLYCVPHGDRLVVESLGLPEHVPPSLARFPLPIYAGPCAPRYGTKGMHIPICGIAELKGVEMLLTFHTRLVSMRYVLQQRVCDLEDKRKVVQNSNAILLKGGGGGGLGGGVRVTGGRYELCERGKAGIWACNGAEQIVLGGFALKVAREGGKEREIVVVGENEVRKGWLWVGEVKAFLGVWSEGVAVFVSGARGENGVQNRGGDDERERRGLRWGTVDWERRNAAGVQGGGVGTGVGVVNGGGDGGEASGRRDDTEGVLDLSEEERIMEEVCQKYLQCGFREEVQRRMRGPCA